MELHIKVIGSILVSLSIIHIIFPRYFNWSRELSSLALVNRQMMYVHTFFIALTVFLMGLLCITSSGSIIGTVLGKRVALGLGLFWSLRFLVQFFVYSSELWKGRLFETVVHVLFSLLWAYFSIIFFMVYFR